MEINTQLHPRLGIGTVQFGMEYGIANMGPRPQRQEIQSILDYASDQGVSIIDTASSYGEAEVVLGETMPKEHQFHVVTKCPSFNKKTITKHEADALEDSFNKSLLRLGADHVYGLLIHNSRDLLANGGELLLERARKLKKSNKVRKLGVSVYDPDEAQHILNRHSIDLIQLPLNVLDQRFILSGIMSKLAEKNIEVHVRSIFLQGALLMSPLELPSHFEGVREQMNMYHTELSNLGITPMEAAIEFVKRQRSIHGLIVGLCSKEQLVEIIAAYRLPPLPISGFERFSQNDERIVDPRRWPTTWS